MNTNNFVANDRMLNAPTFAGRKISFDPNEFSLIPMGKGLSQGADNHARLATKKEEEKSEAEAEVGGSIILGAILSALGVPHVVHVIAETAKVIGENLAGDEKQRNLLVDANLDPKKMLNPSECFKPASTKKSVFFMPSPFAAPSVQEEHAAALAAKKKSKLKKMFGRM